MNRFLAILTSVSVEIPVYLAWLTAFILALVHWKRHPKVSQLVVIAVVLFFILSVVNTSLNIWLPMSMYDKGVDAAKIGTIMQIKGFVLSFLDAGLWAMVIAAIFGERKPKPPVMGMPPQF